jgi:ribosomal protein S3
MFDELDVKGIKFRLKGKISVAGNARTRTLLQRTGVTGHATFNNKVMTHLSLVPSFTGVMGLKV